MGKESEMGYAHIDNLYKDTLILQFKECYAMEKIHGTSAHVGWEGKEVHFFAGGEKHERFIALFNTEALKAKFLEIFGTDCQRVTIYGEAYGGKLQGMSHTYGKDLKFIAFEVSHHGDSIERFESVDRACETVGKLGLEFVHFNKIPATIEAINAERDADSVQAVRNGIGSGKMREGVVLRPLFEVRLNNGARVISKHKRAEFQETKTPREVNPDKLQILRDAEKIAEEWVTPMRLEHVLQKMPEATEISHTGAVIKAVVEDVCREASGEIVENKDARKAIGARAAKLYKSKVTKIS